MMIAMSGDFALARPGSGSCARLEVLSVIHQATAVQPHRRDRDQRVS